MDPRPVAAGGSSTTAAEGAVPGTGGNVYDNIPDDIYPYP